MKFLSVFSCLKGGPPLIKMHKLKESSPSVIISQPSKICDGRNVTDGNFFHYLKKKIFPSVASIVIVGQVSQSTA